MTPQVLNPQETESYNLTDSHNSTSNEKRSKSCKRSWSQAEDEKLLRLVEDHGSINWSIIAENFEGRTGKQCRERYNNHLQPDIKKGDWTPEEDLIIVEMQAKYGNHWSKITKMLPGRTDNAIKNRWHAAVRATSRGTYTKDCGLLSNIRRQPVIPRLQLDTIAVPEKETKFIPYPSLTQPQPPQPEKVSHGALDAFSSHARQIEHTRVEVIPVYTANLMALAHEHTHDHMPMSDDSDMSSQNSADDDESSVQMTPEPTLKQDTTTTPIDQFHGNEVMTARSNFSVNSMDLNTLITLIKGENVASGTPRGESQRGESLAVTETPADASYEFDWQSPRFFDDKSPRLLDDRSPRLGDLDRSPRLSEGWTPRLLHETPRLHDGRSLRLPDSATRLPDGGPVLKRFRGIAHSQPPSSP
mmetsp:Transcript_26245/g.26493  ORF Transcript_26245/g.26493 Transcript_26245/m.26493 type:complete len:415 (+) Transcript_26245:36-1280(+)